jgi:hypothetical protein
MNDSLVEMNSRRASCIRSIKESSHLTDEEKRRIEYYLTDEDFVNEYFAMKFFADLVLDLTKRIDERK